MPFIINVMVLLKLKLSLNNLFLNQKLQIHKFASYQLLRIIKIHINKLGKSNY